MNWKDKMQELEATNWSPEPRIGQLVEPTTLPEPPPPPPPVVTYNPHNPMEVLRFILDMHARDLASLESAAKAGDVRAIRVRNDISRRQSELLGLDTPKELNVNVARRRDPNNLKAYTTEELRKMYAEQLVIEGESHRE